MKKWELNSLTEIYHMKNVDEKQRWKTIEILCIRVNLIIRGSGTNLGRMNFFQIRF